MVEINERVLGPNLYTKLFPSDQPSGTLQQDGKNLEWLPLQTHFQAVFPQLASPQISFKSSEAKNLDSLSVTRHKQLLRVV
jgi:hypothetical protein